MKRRHTSVLLLIAAGCTAATWADDATNRAGIERAYTNRVQLHNVDMDVRGPDSQGSLDVPKQSEDHRLSSDLGASETAPPIYIPQPQRPPPDKKKAKTGWLDLTGKDASDSDKKKSSGWGWLADDVRNAEKADKDATQDVDSAESEQGDDQRSTGPADKKNNSFIDQAFKPHLAPDLYRDKPADNHDAKTADRSGPAQVDVGVREEAPALTSADMERLSAPEVPPLHDNADAIERSGADIDAARAPSFSDATYTPQFAAPTPMPGDSASYQAVSPSLGGMGAASGGVAPVNDADDGQLKVSVDPSESSASRDSGSSLGSSDSSGNVRPTTLPW